MAHRHVESHRADVVRVDLEVHEQVQVNALVLQGLVSVFLSRGRRSPSEDKPDVIGVICGSV